MRVADDVTGLIASTPPVGLDRLADAVGATIVAVVPSSRGRYLSTSLFADLAD